MMHPYSRFCVCVCPPSHIVPANLSQRREKGKKAGLLKQVGELLFFLIVRTDKNTYTRADISSHV